jgi:hypothetical protein
MVNKYYKNVNKIVSIYLIMFPIIIFSQFNTPIIDSSYLKYNLFIDSATISYKNNKYVKSLEYYDNAFSIKNYIFVDYLNAFNISMETGLEKKTFEYLYEGIKNGGLDISIYSFDNLDIFLNTDYGKKILLIKDSLYNIYKKNIDTLYLENLKELFNIDQINRSDSEIYNLSDSINFSKLILLSEKNGFPTYKTTGIGLHYADAILWHQRSYFPDSLMWKQIIPLIKMQILNGDLDPNFLNYYFEFIEKKSK